MFAALFGGKRTTLLGNAPDSDAVVAGLDRLHTLDSRTSFVYSLDVAGLRGLLAARTRATATGRRAPSGCSVWSVASPISLGNGVEYSAGVSVCAPASSPAFGVIDGLYQGVTAIARLASGIVADRWRDTSWWRLGYALSAVCKLGLLATGAS